MTGEAAAPAGRTGPVVIAYDGSDGADNAIRESGALLKGRPALVVTVWKEGIGFELVENPAVLGVPPVPVVVREAIEIDEAIRERSEKTAQHGAQLAAQAGFSSVEAMAVADSVEIAVADTIVDLARERAAPAIVVGAHGHGRLAEITMGSISRDVVRRAPCPVVVVREAPSPAPSP